MCLGESTARNAYYLFVTSLIKTFNFENMANMPLPILDPVNGLHLSYEGFQAKLSLRENEIIMTRL